MEPWQEATPFYPSRDTNKWSLFPPGGKSLTLFRVQISETVLGSGSLRSTRMICDRHSSVPLLC